MPEPRRFGGMRPTKTRGALSVVCPRCGAGVGWRCVKTMSHGGTTPMKEPHRERIQEARG